MCFVPGMNAMIEAGRQISIDLRPIEVSYKPLRRRPVEICG
jgi:hypothetical protein